MQKIERYFEYPQDTRWATDEEIMSPVSSVKIDLSKPPYEAAGLILKSDGRTAYIDDLDHHSLIVGTTGSGKSRLLCMPMIQIMANAGESYIVTDPKGELYQMTSGLARSRGYQVIVLNFRDVAYGDMWNPLKIPYDLYREGKKDQALSIVNDLVMTLTASMDDREGSFWIQMAQSLILANLLLLFETAKPAEVNMRSLCRLCLDYGKERKDNPIYELQHFMEPDSIAAMNFAGVCVDAERTRSSIMGVVHSVLRLFNSQEGLLSMMADSSFDMRHIGRKKTAIYMIIPDEKSTYHFLVSMFTKQCYEMLIAEAVKEEEKVLPIRVNFMLDEFPNLPKIPDMPSMITAARSRNIRFHLVVQGLEQLKSKYGNDTVTITSNCENWIYLNSKEYACLEELSKRCGSLLDTHDHIRPLITASRLQRLNKEAGEALVFHGRMFPYISHLADISAYSFEFLEAVALESIKRHEAEVFHASELLERLRREDGPLLFAGGKAKCSESKKKKRDFTCLTPDEIDEELRTLSRERNSLAETTPANVILYFLARSKARMDNCLNSLKNLSADKELSERAMAESDYRNSLFVFAASCELYANEARGWYESELKRLLLHSCGRLNFLSYYPVNHDKTVIALCAVAGDTLTRLSDGKGVKSYVRILLSHMEELSEICNASLLRDLLSKETVTVTEAAAALLTEPSAMQENSPYRVLRKKNTGFAELRDAVIRRLKEEAQEIRKERKN